MTRIRLSAGVRYQLGAATYEIKRVLPDRSLRVEDLRTLSRPQSPTTC
jgi:hypothetical protein